MLVHVINFTLQRFKIFFKKHGGIEQSVDEAVPVHIERAEPLFIFVFAVHHINCRIHYHTSPSLSTCFVDPRWQVPQ